MALENVHGGMEVQAICAGAVEPETSVHFHSVSKGRRCRWHRGVLGRGGVTTWVVACLPVRTAPAAGQQPDHDHVDGDLPLNHRPPGASRKQSWGN